MHGKSGAHGTEAEKRTEFGDGTPQAKEKPLKTYASIEDYN